jgi:hypothetical protein
MATQEEEEKALSISDGKSFDIVLERPAEVSLETFRRYRKALNGGTERYLKGRLIYAGRSPIYLTEDGQETTHDDKEGKLFYKKGIPYERSEPRVLGRNKFKQS